MFKREILDFIFASFISKVWYIFSSFLSMKLFFGSTFGFVGYSVTYGFFVTYISLWILPNAGIDSF